MVGSAVLCKGPKIKVTTRPNMVRKGGHP